MKKILCLSVLLSLVGCGSPKDASESNFKKAISEYLETSILRGAYCLRLDYSNKWPIKIYEEDYNHKELIALEKIGLLKGEIIPGDTMKPFSSQKIVYKAISYTVTEEGKKYIYPKPSTANITYGALCYAKKRLTEVEKWTEPSNMFGATVTEVAYKYKLTDIADWAKNPEIEKIFNTDKILNNDDSSAKIVLYLTNKGWEAKSDRM